jgi:hypothetical protein
LSAGIQTTASAAGGEAFRVVGQADRSFERIESQTSRVYRLGVEAPPNTARLRYLDVKVSVNRSNATVLARRHGVVLSTERPTVSVDEALKARIAQGGFAFGVPVRLVTALRRLDGNREPLQMVLDIEVPPLATAPLVAMFAVIDGSGKTISAGRKEMTAPAQDTYRLTLPVSVGAGDYRVRVAVADANGNVGSVERQLAARLARFGSVAVSDVMASWVDGNLRVGLELYPEAGKPAAVTVRLGLFRAETGEPIVEREILPARNQPALSVIATLPGTVLSPGSYVIRATVLEGGREVGTAARQVHKAR